MSIKTLNKIKQEIMQDPENMHKTQAGILPLFSVVPESKIIIIGQAPGTKAERTQKTWNDPSGDRLREWLGVNREEFYNPANFAQMPMDFYYPGKAKTGDMPPRKGFAQKWHNKILACVKDAKLIILVGSYAQNYYIADKVPLTQRVKNFENYLPKFFVLSHPSPLNHGWRKQNEWFDEIVLPNLKKLVREILNKN